MHNISYATLTKFFTNSVRSPLISTKYIRNQSDLFTIVYINFVDQHVLLSQFANLTCLQHFHKGVHGHFADGQFADRQFTDRQFAERTVRRHDSSPTGQFADRTVRRQDGSPTIQTRIRENVASTFN